MYTAEQAVRIALLENTSVTEDAIKSVQDAVRGLTAGAIDMVLHYPSCGVQHIDAPDERTADWKNPDHRSHLCHGCGHIWRPADVPTNGVQVVLTKGKDDSPIAVGGVDIITYTMEPPSGPVVAWIIEKVGHPVSMTHYKTVADSKRSMGFTVTDHHSRVTA